MSWQNLEDMMKELLLLDMAMTVPGSGNGKGEEDIIGLSTITQCKYSEKVNISILRKDVDRLLDAAKLQNKIPIFATENNGLILITIPESIILRDVLHMIVGMSLIRFIQENCDSIKTISERNEYRKLLNRGDKIVHGVIFKYNSISDSCRMSLANTIEENLEYLKTL